MAYEIRMNMLRVGNKLDDVSQQKTIHKKEIVTAIKVSGFFLKLR